MENEAANPQSEGSTGSPGSEQQQQANPFEERMLKLEQMMTGFGKQLNGLSAAQRATAKKTADEPTQEQQLTLKGLKAELDAKESRLREKAIRTEVDAWCKTNGIPEAQRPFLKAYVNENYKAKADEHGNVSGLTVDENDEVVWINELGDRKSFGDLGSKILASLGGQTFQQPAQTPGPVGQRQKTGVQASGGPKPIGQWTEEDFQRNPQAGLDLIMQAHHPGPRGQR